MPTNIKNQKVEARSALLRDLSLPKNTRAIVWSQIHDKHIQSFLKVAGEAIGVVLLDTLSEKQLAGCDALITDDWSTSDLSHIFQDVIVPIGPFLGSEKYGLSEFNPMKFEGNAFLFEKVDEYNVFAALVCYLENVKYPGDKSTLLKNVTEKK